MPPPQGVNTVSRLIRPILPTLAIALAAGMAALVGGAASAQTTPVDYDADNDNLIEITTLEQLDAVRLDLDGNGGPIDPGEEGYAAYTAAFPNPAAGMGCKSDCIGYELARSLDFNADSSYVDANTNKTGWTTGDGWTPIGDSATPFVGTFDGNGHAISNLYIRAASISDAVYAGLFGSIGTGGVVRNVGVDSGSVTAKVRTTTGTDSPAYAGGLAGTSGGTITDSWANVTVEADTTGPYVTGNNADVPAFAGGLVGDNRGGTILRSYAMGGVEADAGGNDVSYAGGLVGYNQGHIGASFATGDALADSSSGTGNSLGGNAYAGGLVGINFSGDGVIVASYATGDAEARSDSNDENAGGLVGLNNVGIITTSYSRGTAIISGNSTTDNSGAGGLVGLTNDPTLTVTASYWDTDTSEITATGAGTGKTTAELKAPTGYGTAPGIYADWDVDYDNNAATGDSTGLDNPWLFGTASDYPRLRELAPMLVSVGVAGSGTLGAGDKVTVTVNFDKRVEVNGSPSLAIAIGGEARTAAYAGTASSTLTFRYTVVRGDNGAVTVPDGSIALNGGAITDLSESDETRPVSLSFTGASVPADLNAETVPPDTTAPSVRYKPPSSLTVGQRIRTIVPITSDTDIASYKLKEGSVLPRTLRLNEETGWITGRPTRAVGRATVVTIIVCDSELDALGNNPNPNCAEVTLKLPAIIDEEADAPPPEPQLPEVPPLDLSNVKVGDPAPTPTLLLALAAAGAALLLAGIGVAAVRRRAPSRSSPADWGRG